MGGNVFGFGDRRQFGFDDNTGQLRGGEHLLRALLQAKGGELMRELSGFGDQARLRELSDSFGRTGGLSPAALASLLRTGAVPQALNMPRPDMDQCPCESSYASSRSREFTDANSPMGRFLRNNPFERQHLEMALGGRILPSGSGDGKLRLEPFLPGTFAPGCGRENQAAFSAQGMLSDIARASGSMDPFSRNIFQGMVLGALGNMAQTQRSGAPNGAPANPEGFSSLRSKGSNPFVDWNDDSPNAKRRRAMFGMGGAPSSGGGMAMSGMSGMGGDFDAGEDRGFSGGGSSKCGDSGGGNECGDTSGCGGGDDINGVLCDPALTVEDKITLMIMMIMKKMDQDIEKQANYINSLQQQQQGGGGKGGKGGGGGAPSIDVETMKLKRLIDKRSQMFDMLRQIIDKYNQTAKGIIDSITRA